MQIGMVLKIAPDTGAIGSRHDPQAFEITGWTDTRAPQHGRRVNGTSAHNDLARRDFSRLTATPNRDTAGAQAVEADFGDGRFRKDSKIAASPYGLREIAACGGGTTLRILTQGHGEKAVRRCFVHIVDEV